MLLHFLFSFCLCCFFWGVVCRWHARTRNACTHALAQEESRAHSLCESRLLNALTTDTDWLLALVPEDDETRQKQQDAMMLLWPMLLRGLEEEQATSESKQQQLAEVHEVSKMLQDIAGDAAATTLVLRARPPDHR